jgi:arylsulfatase A-like enzyme
MSRRPNILLITSDQHRGDCFGFEGRKVKTPHLDELARDGTRFSACITPSVICQPARASLLTGLLPLTHGVHDNGIDLAPEIGERGFAAQLGRAGYRTGLVGKAHFSTSHTYAPTGTPECRTSSADYGPDWFGPYMGFEHVELVVEGHNVWPPMKPPHGQHYERWYHADGRGEERDELYFRRAAPDRGAIQTWHSGLPVAWHNTTWIGNQSIRFMERHKDEPFCLWASFPDPHHPFDAPEPWSRLHPPEEVDLPARRTLDLDRRPWWHRASLEGTPDARVQAIRGNFLQLTPQTDDQLRELIANYYGMISLIDHNVGRMLIALQELGIADNTLVVFTADHGEWLGDHGLIFKGPMMYEGVLRVGLILRGPGIPAGEVIRDPVSTLDLPATLCGYAGAPTASLRHSRSLLGVVAGEERREAAYNEWDLGPQRCGVALELRTVRSRSHRLTVDLRSGAGELYDLTSDPLEEHNLFDEPSAAEHRRALLRVVEQRPADIMNPLPAPSGMA